MDERKKKQKGITLIALVISIIVMLILSGISLNMTIGENGIISQSQLAILMSKFANYREQLELNAVEDEGVYASGNIIRNYIPDMEDIDIEKFVIMKRELMYVENDELEIKACKNVGIQTADTGEEGSASAISEVKAVINGVVNLASNEGDGFRVPEDDFDVTIDTKDSNVGLVGTRLYDRNSLNLINKTWNILIEYDKNNQETARYGSGYYWLKKGETYTIGEETKKFENDFIVDYANKKYYILSGRAVNWNDSSTIAVSNGLVLNLDPISFADGEWKQDTANPNFYDFYVKDSRTNREENTGIQKTGDVLYDPQIKALKFNESVDNIDGVGGYLKLESSTDLNIDFSNGFTFEINSNFSRLGYNNGRGISGGLFFRGKYLGYDRFKSMRFLGYGDSGSNVTLCKFGSYSGNSLSNIPHDILTTDTENINVPSSKLGYGIGDNVYLTYNYIVCNDNNKSILSDYETLKNGNFDRFEYYVNGKLVGYTYYPHITYTNGLTYWNTNDCPFFVGICEWNYDDSFYYIKGNVYTTRLYTQPMTASQVKDNYDTTLKYRSSF